MNEKLKSMGVTQSSRLLDSIIFFGGLALFITLGYISALIPDKAWWSMWSGATAAGILWISIYLSAGLKLVPAQTALIIEQFSNYKRTIKPGWNVLCFPGFIDIIVSDPIKLNRQKMSIVNEKKEAVEIDFDCGTSAPVIMEAWFQITTPESWHYRTDAPLQWFHDQASAFMQPILERRTLDEARKNKRQIAGLYRELKDKEVEIHFIDSEGLSKSENPHSEGSSESENPQEKKITFKDYVEKRIGIAWSDILIVDIQIPDDIQKIRALTLAANVDKKTRAEIATGYATAILALKHELSEKSGQEVSLDIAREIYDINENRKTLEKTGSNVTIIGQDVASMLATMIQNK